MTETAHDGRGGTANATFTWTIAAANVAPVMTDRGPQSGTVGVAVSLQIAATDGDGDALIYGTTGCRRGSHQRVEVVVTGDADDGGSDPRGDSDGR